MKRCFVKPFSIGRRAVAPACLVVAVVVLAGCLSTWEFPKTGLNIMIVKVGNCANWYPLDYQADPGDTVTFFNHAGRDLVLEFPAGTVTAQDEDPSTTTITEVSVEKGRKKDVTIVAEPVLTLDSSGNGVIIFFIKDPCHGGAKMIIQPADS